MGWAQVTWPIETAHDRADAVDEQYDTRGVPVLVTVDPNDSADDDDEVLSVRDFASL